MKDPAGSLSPDPELASRLRALHDAPSAHDVAALRARVLAAAAPQLSARAAATAAVAGTSSAKPVLTLRRSTWLDVTSGFGRVAIPLSLAAAILAMLVLRSLPSVGVTDESTTMAMANTMVSDSLSAPQLADELVMPEDADAVLLAPSAREERQ